MEERGDRRWPVMLDHTAPVVPHVEPPGAPSAPGRRRQHPHGLTGLERYRLAHRALPGRDLAEVDLGTSLLGAALAAPIVVSARAGDDGLGRLARAATEHGLGLVLGGGEALLADRELIGRYHTPDRPPLLLAAVALEHVLDADAPEQAERLVGMLDADGIVVELDAVGTATRPGGDAHARGVDGAIAAIVERLAPLPVVVRETGSGMDGADARALMGAGVAAVDVGGAAARERDGAFARWGVPTADAIAEAVLLAPGLPVIAGGPLHDGVEVAACLALGATAACLERPFADVAPEAADAVAAALVHQLRVAVWAVGAPGAAGLHAGHLRVAGLA